MKIMLDTNVLISALIFGGKTGKLLQKLFDSEHIMYISEYVDCEFREKLQNKWPQKAEKVYQLYRTMNFRFCESTKQMEGNLRDRKDIPVLSDALYHNVDLILTGDKDFLEAGLEKPLIYSPAMLYDFLEKRKEEKYGSLRGHGL